MIGFCDDDDDDVRCHKEGSFLKQLWVLFIAAPGK